MKENNTYQKLVKIGRLGLGVIIMISTLAGLFWQDETIFSQNSQTVKPPVAISTGTIGAAAANPVTVSLNTAQYAQYASEFTAQVAIPATPGLSAAQFQISYDPQIFEVTGVTAGTLITGADYFHFSFYPESTQGKLRFAIQLYEEYGINAAGSLAAITFNTTGVSGAASNLDFISGVQFGNQLFDYLGNLIEPVAWQGSSITTFAQ